MKDLSQFSLLVVDDDPDIRSSIVRDLKRKGFRLFDAPSGNEALKILRSETIDLVVSDVRMPDGNGIELLSSIRADNAKVPIVVLITGFADMTVDEIYHRGANAILDKPFERKALYETILRQLTPPGEKWLHRPERVPCQERVEIQCTSLRDALDSKILNIGTGGFFLSLLPPFPPMGSRIDFVIRSSDRSAAPLIQGVGIVRWTRTQAQEGSPTGCGIEFEDLSNEAMEQIIELIATLKAESYIPKA